MIRKIPWFFHPIFVFVFSIVALASSLVLYIYWYVSVSAGLQRLARHYRLDPGRFLEARTWVVILVLSILVAIILVGTLIIFIYSQKMLRLNRLQHEFINNFTHELKTPLTSLKIYLETLLKYDLTRNEQVKYVNYMLQDTERLGSNVSRILNLARIETKTYAGDYQDCDLVQTIEQCYEQNRHHFEKCDITIHHPAENAVIYPINPFLFEMLVMNLLTNAVQYNEQERPRIDIRFVRQKKAMHIRFEDNGIGIKKEYRKKIFRKFFQIGQAKAQATRGSGLGLYLVQQIARMHRGKVIAESREDEQGSVFTLILPLHQGV